MKTTTLLLVVALAFASVVAVAPSAAADGCPNPDHPCTPTPLDPLACSGTPKITNDPVMWVKCQL